MKTNLFRQKYNNLLQRFIRLFSLSSVAFAVTACYGTMPIDDMAAYKVTGQITNQQDQPLDSMQVHFYLDRSVATDYFYSDSTGEYHAELWTWTEADTLLLVVSDPKKEYDSSTTKIAVSDMELLPHEKLNCSYSAEVDFQLKKK